MTIPTFLHAKAAMFLVQKQQKMQSGCRSKLTHVTHVCDLFSMNPPDGPGFLRSRFPTIRGMSVLGTWKRGPNVLECGRQ